MVAFLSFETLFAGMFRCVICLKRYRWESLVQYSSCQSAWPDRPFQLYSSPQEVFAMAADGGLSSFLRNWPRACWGLPIETRFSREIDYMENQPSTPGRIRTCDLLIRSQLLYPAELRGHIEELPSGTSVDDFDNPKVYLFAVFLSRIVSFGSGNPYN